MQATENSLLFKAHVIGLDLDNSPTLKSSVPSNIILKEQDILEEPFWKFYIPQ